MMAILDDVRDNSLLNYDFNKFITSCRESWQDAKQTEESLGSGGTVKTRWSLKPVPKGV